MGKQIAVEFLITQISKDTLGKSFIATWKQEFEQAKQIEKEQIMNFYMKNLPIKDGVITAVQKAENYYYETFKNK